MRTDYVASGEYRVIGDEPVLVKALLGSCVGVAVLDRGRGVGGLVHLLLPEPLGDDSSWNPLCFAGSGLPLFLDALAGAGARPQHLEAVVAGGALFGVLSRQDINLDIGGRTIEKVQAVLRERAIPIVREESGGFYSSVLTLRAPALEAAIESGLPAEAAPFVPERPVAAEEIDRAVASVVPVPQAALKVIRLVSGDYDMGEVARAIMADQVLGAKVLSLCNSPLFAVRKRIDSLEQALTILGESHLVEMVASAAVETFLEQHKGGYSLLRGGLYRHALGVAHAAKAVAKAAGAADLDPGVSYTAGLLHDIGKIVLDQYFAAFLPEFYRQAEPGRGDMIEQERAHLSVDHQEVGARLAASWDLPENITAVVGGHHRPASVPDRHRLLANAVYVADLLTTWFLAGMEHERISDRPLRGALADLGLEAADLAVVSSRVPWTKLMYV